MFISRDIVTTSLNNVDEPLKYYFKFHYKSNQLLILLKKALCSIYLCFIVLLYVCLHLKFKNKIEHFIYLYDRILDSSILYSYNFNLCISGI